VSDRPGSAPPPPDLLRRALRRAAESCTDPLVRRWLRRLVERGEYASGDACLAGKRAEAAHAG
jgi:hypothetical protein